MTEETKAARAKHPNERTENEWDLLLVAYELPRHCHEGLLAHILRGRPVGHFLTAVLEGNLFEACARADDENRGALVQYARFLVNCAPSGCFGSPEKVESWRERGGLIGMIGMLAIDGPLGMVEFFYPPDWPKCRCGLPVMDGHLTCGKLECDEAQRRRELQDDFAANKAIEAPARKP